MSTTVTVPPGSGSGASPDAGRADRPQREVVRRWATPITFAVLAVISLLVFALGASGASATFRISTESDAVQIPDIVAPTIAVGWTITVLLAVLTVWGYLAVRRRGTVPGWGSAAFAVLFVAGFLVWVVGAADTTTVFLTGLLAGAFVLAVPLIFGALAGVLCERSGVVNIAIEGQLLAGAFTPPSRRRSPATAGVGPARRAIVAGVLVSALLAVFSIRYLVNQVIVGVVLNVCVTRADQLPVLHAVLPEEHRDLQHPAATSAPSRSRCSATSRSSARCFFDADHLVYIMYVARGRRLTSACSAPEVGPAPARRRRAPQGRRHRGHQRAAHPVRQRVAGRRRSPASAARSSRSARSAPSARR